jgi:hypothetical protein
MVLRSDGGPSLAAANTWTGSQTFTGTTTFSNHVLFTATNTYDIGQTGFGNSPRHVWVAGDLAVQNAIQATYGIGLSATATIRSSGSGIIELFNTAETGFTRLNFGGTTSSFPALKRSTTELQIRLADDSAGADFSARRVRTPMTSELTIATGAVTVTGTFHRIDTEADGAADDLDTINGGTDGAILVIRAENDARTVVAKDGTGNLQLAGDMTLDNTQDSLTLIFDATLNAWLELARAGSGA